jgi:hypothetical protein
MLGSGLDRAGIASPYSDPVSHLRAQDESIYANSAIGLAARGGWLTPKAMGRFMLFKPPLLVWFAGAFLKVFGTSVWALRLPVLLVASAATTLLFYWFGGGADGSSWAVFLLLVSNPLWHTFSRLCYTDMLLAAAFTGAMFCVYRDPDLGSRRAFFGFALCTAAGIMAKNIAGLLPLFVLVLYVLAIGKQGVRPSFPRLAQLGGVILAAAAPWHVYQWIVHRNWFLADYAGVQIIEFGLHPPAQNAHEGPVRFYAERLALMDPVLILAVLIASPVLARRLWKDRPPELILLFSWLAVAVSALLAFQFRNLPYAVSLVPVLCLMAARMMRKRAWIYLLGLIFLVKAMFPDQIWGLPFTAPAPIPMARPLRDYWQLGRPNELVLISPEDEFYAFNLPGLKVRYCFLDPSGTTVRYAPHYAYLGITLTGAQFLDVSRIGPEYGQRLRSWGLDSSSAIGSALAVDSLPDLQRLVSGLPHTDFELPEAWRISGGPEHEIRRSAPGRVFLLARNPPGTPALPRPNLPAKW